MQLYCGHTVDFGVLKRRIDAEFHPMGDDNRVKTKRLFYRGKQPLCKKCKKAISFDILNELYGFRLRQSEFIVGEQRLASTMKAGKKKAANYCAI